MSESTEVQVFTGSNLPAPKFDQSAIDAAVSSQTYLPRVQLLTSNSQKCKDGEIPPNTYCLINGQTYTELGKEIDVAVLRARPKAMEIGDEVITIHDPKMKDGKPTGKFAEIQSRADNSPDSGCMYGVEYLIWVPDQQQFATILFGSKSTRRESPNMTARVGKVATLKSKKIETAKYTWYSISVSPCSNPVSLPDESEMLAEIEKFDNPEDLVPEEVDSSEGRER